MQEKRSSLPEMSSSKSSLNIGYLMVIAAGTLWGVSDACGQYVFSHYPAFSSISLTVIRGLVAGSILCIFNFFRRRDAFLGIWQNRKDALQLVTFAICGLMLSQFTTFKAIQVTNAGTATVLQELSPVIILTVSCGIGRKLPQKVEVAAVVLAVFGTFLLATHGNIHQMVLTPEGLFWGLSSAASAAAYTILSSRIARKWGSGVVICFGLIISGVCLTLITRAWNLPVQLGADGWLAVGGVLLCGTMAAYELYVGGVALIGPVRGGMLACLEPLVATLLSVLWLGTHFEPLDLIGFACIILTVLILTRK